MHASHRPAPCSIASHACPAAAKLMGVGSEGGLWRVAPDSAPCADGMCGQGVKQAGAWRGSALATSGAWHALRAAGGGPAASNILPRPPSHRRRWFRQPEPVRRQRVLPCLKRQLGAGGGHGWRQGGGGGVWGGSWHRKGLRGRRMQLPVLQAQALLARQPLLLSAICSRCPALLLPLQVIAGAVNGTGWGPAAHLLPQPHRQPLAQTSSSQQHCAA